MDTKKALDDATSSLMEAISEAANQRRVTKQHMNDPDNFVYARNRRAIDAEAGKRLEKCIVACEAHLAAVARSKVNSPEVKP
jgi:hypothetical protein